MKKEKIAFQSYNPYQVVCPVTRVVSYETLRLIKMFRSKGLDASVEPEDNSKLSYYSKRGWQVLFSDPVTLFLINVPLSIILDITSSWHYYLLKAKPSLPKNKIPLVIEVYENGNKSKYSYDGQLINDDMLLDIQIKMKQSHSRLKTLFSTPPSFTQPFPVYLEDTNQVIGRADKLYQDGRGTIVERIMITNVDVWERIQSGELKGLSIAEVVTSSECSICKKEYSECNHMPPNIYHGKTLTNRIRKACLAEVSIVKEPIEPLRHIKEISFKENQGDLL